MDLELRGKRALITGSNSGIGEAIATTLAGEGVSVVIHGRNEARARAVADKIAASHKDIKVAVALGDVASEAGADAVAHAADKAFGGIDILVNNAGGPKEGPPDFFSSSPEDWIETYERNMISALRLSTYFVPQMKERKWGRVIQITSGLAWTPVGQNPDYCASKGALNNFTLNLAKALANSGVTVNGVSPGMTVTPMLEAWLEDMAEANGMGRDKIKGEEFVLKHVVPLTVARLGRPQDIANAVAFVASPKADYMNGTNIRVDGGGSPSVN